MRYEKGESGNPAGRPPGIKDRRTAMRELLQPHAEELVAKVVEMAKAGDTTALRICIDRLIPPMKARDESVPLPAMADSLADSGRVILQAMADERLTPEEAAHILQALSTQARIVETAELEQRIAALESKHAKS